MGHECVYNGCMATTPLEKDNNVTTTFTLKNLKVCEWASEETTCFTATLYVDGKRIGECRNDGQGGCNFYDFNEQTYTELAANWLWENHCENYKDIPRMLGERSEFKPDLDYLVWDLLEQNLVLKDVKAWRTKLVKKFPAKADTLSIYKLDQRMWACFNSDDVLKVLVDYPSARPAPTEAKVTF